MDFNHYFTFQEIDELLQDWSGKYKDLIEIESLGSSFEKRPIWLASITNKKTGSAAQKPAVWVDANIHATEISGTTAALYLIDRLLTGYGQDQQITRLLDQSAFYVVPRVNPDGANLAMAKNPRFIRSGVRPYPWDEKDDGLHGEDINGDGRILQMRVKDPNGDWKISDLDPRLLQKRAPDESEGTYYRLLEEGMLENYDGDLIKFARPHQGLDFNRNFPFQWRPEAEQSGAGPYPASEPEIRALLDFISSHPNINHAVTFHTFSRVILRPYSTKPDDEMDTDDLWVYKKIGEHGTKLTGYRCVSTFHDFKYHPKEVTTGAFDDWIYDHLGVFSYTIELWDLPTEAGIKDRKFMDWWRDHPHEEDLQILQWADDHAPGSYVDWQPFEHPQLGTVELGGWDGFYSWRNPPPALIEAEVSRHVPFVLFLAETLPHLVVKKQDVVRLTENSYRLRLVVENTGFLPTCTSNQGRSRKAARQVRAELKLPEGVTLLNGKARDEFGHLEGRSNKLDVSAVYGTSPTDNRAYLEWVFQAPPGTSIPIEILSDRAGTIHLSIRLE